MHYIKKDISKVGTPAVIIHGVNCQKAMGSGVAKALYKKWPQVREYYLHIPKEEMILGKVQEIKIDDSLYVLYCWSQDKFGHDGKVYASLSAIEECLLESIKFALSKNLNKIYSPKIGCGLGGLNWDNQVKPIFIKLEKLYPKIEFIICSLDS